MCFAEMNKVSLEDPYVPESKDIFKDQWVIPKGHRIQQKKLLPPTKAEAI